jgi:glucosamine--fructose-6-phosphate aminotransferase (isomerizing)
MDAGPEIGVASTKAFTSMVLCLYTFAVALAEKRKVATAEERKNFFANLRAMPALVDKAISQEVYIDDVSGDFYQESNCLFIGRGISFPIAIEGALKLKEISYIHAEGYAGGELKHGPIALIDQNMTVVAIVPQFFHREKMISNIEEVKARKGRILALGAHEDEELTHLATRFISVPQIQDEVMQSILSVIPLQLFAYYAAVRRGTDVDQPRNLAKSVTVE